MGRKRGAVGWGWQLRDGRRTGTQGPVGRLYGFMHNTGSCRVNGVLDAALACLLQPLPPAAPLQALHRTTAAKAAAAAAATPAADAGSSGSQADPAAAAGPGPGSEGGAAGSLQLLSPTEVEATLRRFEAARGARTTRVYGMSISQFQLGVGETWLGRLRRDWTFR